MKEIPIEVLFSRGTDYLWLYTSPYGFFTKYDNCNNGKDWNYIFWRFNVKQSEQDVFTLIKTSQHCYTLTHYRILDGFNEIKRFGRLFDVAQYLLRAMRDYDEIYAAYLAEEERLKEERRREREEKAANKKNKATTAEKADSK